jgi:hypothetical protein
MVWSTVARVRRKAKGARFDTKVGYGELRKVTKIYGKVVRGSSERASQHFIDGGIIPSRNALIVAALERFLLELERQEIDRQFAAMAEDKTYQAMNQQLADDFAESDWDAWVEGEAG